MKQYLSYLERENLKQKADQMLGYANNAKAYAQRIGSYTVERTRKFSLMELTLFKVCLVSLGLWVGATFSNVFKKLRGFLLVAFAASWVYLFWRVFVDEE